MANLLKMSTVSSVNQEWSSETLGTKSIGSDLSQLAYVLACEKPN